jgi:predicted DNA-binding transcriptional regulator YafY
VSSTGARTLSLLSLLQRRRHWSGPELAARLEVSARTLRRDVERLRDLGYPVQATRGLDGGYRLGAGAALPPLLLDDEQAVALAVGLHAAAASGATGTGEASVRVLATLSQVLPARLRRRVEALVAMTVPAVWGSAGTAAPPADLLLLATACRDGERVRFGYTSATGERTEREVEPHRLVPLGRRWYLVAYDLVRQDWRSFRLDRLTDLARTGALARPRELPAADAAAFVRAGMERVPEPYRVEVLVDAPVAVVDAAVGRWGTTEDAGDGRTRLRMSADSLDWPCHALGTLPAEFRVVAPPELVAQLADWAGRFGRAVDAATAG